MKTNKEGVDYYHIEIDKKEKKMSYQNISRTTVVSDRNLMASISPPETDILCCRKQR